MTAQKFFSAVFLDLNKLNTYNKYVMRMRRKKHLEDRMLSADAFLIAGQNDGFYALTEADRYAILDFSEIFGNNNPLWLELGAGKGAFAFELAARNPDKNVVAVEKISNVIIEALERADREKPTNCRFMNCSVENLKYYIADGVVERIFLNFSCPYPKKSYRNRRLTNERFLRLYKKLLVKNGEIHFKTDNREFFEYSLQTLSENGFILKNISLDMTSENFPENIETEYEKMFRAQGKKIYRVEALLK